MAKKKILMCYNSSDYGGVEKQIFDIIRGLSKDFDFYIAVPNGPLVEDYLNAGAVKHFNIFPRNEIDFKYILDIFKIIRKEKIKVLHAHELRCGLLAALGGWLALCPTRVYHVHTPFSQWQHKGFKKYLAAIFNWIGNFIAGNIFATDVLALTESIKNIRIKKELINKNKISVIPNGVDENTFVFSESQRNKYRENYKIKSTDKVFGYIARFTEEKGHKELLQAFELLCLNHKNIKLLLAGGGKLLEETKDKVKNIGISKKVIFTGKFEDDEKISILSSMDIFVFPTKAEGFGIVLIEALMMKIPSIVSDLPVLKDVGEDSVLYFRKDNIEEMALKMELLLSDKKMFDELKLKSRKQAVKFSIERFWQNYRSLYYK
jgi:glycosyltransferase EpsF